MKKYIIKYADGREQRFIRDNYNSRKEAEEALLIYLCDHNEKCDDSSYLSSRNTTKAPTLTSPSAKRKNF